MARKAFFSCVTSSASSVLLGRHLQKSHGPSLWRLQMSSSCSWSEAVPATHKSSPCYYSSYLHLADLLTAQCPLSAAHDEHLFIVTHQSFELWFKQVLIELGSVISILSSDGQEHVQLQLVVERLQRINRVLVLLIQQFSVLETMTPPSFLEFRPNLESASGFQSVQFKLLEMRMGLSVEDRLSLSSNTYTSALSTSDRDIVESAASSSNLLSALNKWLSIYPLHVQILSTFWPGFTTALSSLSPEQSANFADIIDPEKHKVLVSKGLRRLSLSAMRSAVAIMSLYKKDQAVALSFNVLSLISEMDALMSKWRFHHASMVHRVLGTAAGSGGSSGVSYLRMTCTRHMVFNDINNVNQYIIPSLML